MAKLANLEGYNTVRRSKSMADEDFSIGEGKTFKFKNKKGDNIIITPMELKEYISEFINTEINLYADENVNQYKEQLKNRFDAQMSNLEVHINDKINKITQDIISTTTNRLINEEVNKRVAEKLQKLKGLL